MNRFGFAAARRVNELIDAQITFGSRRRADVNGFVGDADVQRQAVGV